MARFLALLASLLLLPSAWGVILPTGGSILLVNKFTNYIELIQFTSVREEPLFLTVTLVGGGKRQLQRNAILAQLENPPASMDDLEVPLAQEQIELIGRSMEAAPQYRAQLTDLRNRWQNLLNARLAAAARNQPRGVPAKGSHLLLKGITYEDAVLIGFETPTLTLRHAAGVAKINVAELTPAEIASINATSTGIKVVYQPPPPVPSPEGSGAPARPAAPGERAALHTPLHVLFGIRVARASLEDLLARGGFAPADTAADQAASARRYRNGKLETEIVLSGNDEISQITIVLPLARVGLETTGDSNAPVRDLANFAVPGSGTWFLEALRAHLKADVASGFQEVKSFGRHQATLAAQPADAAGKVKDLVLTLVRNLPEKAGGTPQFIESLVLQPSGAGAAAPNPEPEALSERVRTISLTVARGAESPEEQSENTISYLAADRLQLALRSKMKKQVFQKPNPKAPGRYVDQWVSTAEKVINLRVQQIPELLEGLQKYEDFRVIAEREKLVKGFVKPIGQEALEMAFVTPDVMKIDASTLEWRDVLLVRQLLALAPDLKKKVDATLEADRKVIVGVLQKEFDAKYQKAAEAKRAEELLK